MPTSLTLQAIHINPVEWLFVLGAIALPAMAVTGLALAGPRSLGWTPLGLLRRAGATVERITGLPAWSASGVAVQIWAMLVAGIGFYWDVAWHIDLGRDTELFTPPHLLILIGLLGFAAGGALSVLYATLDAAPTAWRLGRLRVPRGAAALAIIGATAAAGFPLDELWHATYGIDVTMWSPTHLMMIGAGAVSPFAAWILLAEAGPSAGRPGVRRALTFQLAVSCLIALASLQLEFDDGVPQWQALFQPVLIGVSATLPLVALRLVAGRGSALAAAVAFLAARVVVAALIGPGLGHVTPHFPLYLGIAASVELGFLVAPRRGVLAASALAGVLAATLGLASEWGFSQVFGREPWQADMLGAMWIPSLATLGAALVGAAFGLAMQGRPARFPRPFVALGVLLIAAGVVLPLPRAGLPVLATVRTAAAGPKLVAVDRYGQGSLFQRVRVEVDVAPADSRVLRGSDWFWVASWQGGAHENQVLREVAPGRWAAPRPVPTGAAWKTIVLLGRHDVVAALPVSLPADPAVQLSAIPVAASRTQAFQPSSRYLMREVHSGPSWPAIVAYSAWLLMVAAWLGFLAAGAHSLFRHARSMSPPAAGPHDRRGAWRGAVLRFSR